MDDAPTAAQNIKGLLGDKLCIYTITVGNENNGAGQDLLEKIAAASGCGFATTDSAISGDAKMAAFIKDVFLATPKAMPKVMAPRDSDGDGVIDDKDQCPNTPKGVSVDRNGCPAKLTLRINFRPDSNAIDEQSFAEVAKAAKCINEFQTILSILMGTPTARVLPNTIRNYLNAVPPLSSKHSLTSSAFLLRV